MTNEEKANKVAEDYLLGHDRANITYEEMLGACLDMAEWKDQQFKEYLEKKREELFNTNCLSVLPYIEFIDEIIKELFSEQEQDNSDNDE